MTKFVLGLVGLIGLAVGTGAYFSAKKKKKSAKKVHIGGSGSGKTRVFLKLKPIVNTNAIQMQSTLKPNPFVYISEINCEKDILKFVDVLIRNTDPSYFPEHKYADWWSKAEKFLLSSYIAMIYTLEPTENRNFETLLSMINDSEYRADDENFKNVIDIQFQFLEYWIDFSGKYAIDRFDEQFMEIGYPAFEEFFNDPALQPTSKQKEIGAFAVKQYKAFKLAAGKRAGAVVSFCRWRLSRFALDESE